MMFKVLPEAEREVVRSAATLERARRTLGTDLRAAYDRALAAVLADPQRYPLAVDAPPDRDVRYCYISRFHYRLLYLLLSGELVVLAFAHTSREPGYWHDRLP